MKNLEHQQSISVWNHTRSWCKAHQEFQIVSFLSEQPGWEGRLAEPPPPAEANPMERKAGWSWSYTPETQTISPGHSSPAFLLTLAAVPWCPAYSMVTPAVKFGSGAQLCHSGTRRKSDRPAGVLPDLGTAQSQPS